MDFAHLTLCVAYGGEDVGRYIALKREEFGLTEDGTEVVRPKPKPWRGFRSGGFLQISEERLVTICSSEQMAEIRRTAVRITKTEVFRPWEVVEEVSSETDSSDELEDFTPNDNGMIRLEELPSEPRAGANLTLAIAAPGGSSDKGKGVMTEPELTWGQLLSQQIGSGSGYANTAGGKANAADAPENQGSAYGNTQGDETPGGGDWDKQGDEDMREAGHLYVGQVFLDRDAFKVHMSLHALANKYRYFVRKSEPGKVVLECNGVNCNWRVYAAKIAECPRFEIKTLESNHQCTVNERGEFRRHATFSIVGGIMRSKYVGSGSGPRPGALREMMRTDHSVPISYWTAWKSREIAIENGRGGAEESYSTLPSYLQQLAVKKKW